ncbi:uncharacterized protein FIBRA_05221 [Fibroporia radiculosa]|uniref:DUF4604 domain-containing protein n=1 Tax=Fibroporia radiculosa TaxID=599839 RepID=J4IAL1_9APHY|nr:uncharacterized protein FIBRA_05221 [Fibroporia radiculosa]CCM03101.1 predicted protein [Fibroporia radiculosa]
MSKEPTRHQLSARLAYNAHTPAFLLRMQQRVSGIGGDEDEDDEFEDDGSGRPPIPKRPAIPQRPDDDPGSADEDGMDEKPQVVVLKEGKHLSERDAENEKRKAKGLPPLPEPQSTDSVKQASETADKASTTPKQTQGLSFASSKTVAKSKSAKRKAVGDARDEDGPSEHKAGKSSKKKSKKAEKKLLSFGDGE